MITVKQTLVLINGLLDSKSIIYSLLLGTEI